MHALGWSKARALAYMIDISGLAPSAAENEIDRYIVWPGQATSYKLGHSEIVRAREAAQADDGRALRHQGFPRYCAADGPQPLEALRRNIDAWAARRFGTRHGDHGLDLFQSGAAPTLAGTLDAERRAVSDMGN